MQNHSSTFPRVGEIVGVAILLSVLLLQLALSAYRNSIAWDEDDHIYSGYISWKTGDFGINPEHPPPVKAVATLPLITWPFSKARAFLASKQFSEALVETVQAQARRTG